MTTDAKLAKLAKAQFNAKVEIRTVQGNTVEAVYVSIIGARDTIVDTYFMLVEDGKITSYIKPRRGYAFFKYAAKYSK